MKEALEQPWDTLECQIYLPNIKPYVFGEFNNIFPMYNNTFVFYQPFYDYHTNKPTLFHFSSSGKIINQMNFIDKEIKDIKQFSSH